jgi:hypothetical protein
MMWLVALLFIGIAIGVLEWRLRRHYVAKEELPRGLFVAHPTLGYMLNPGFCGRSNRGIEYRVNELGLRDYERTYVRDTDNRRILALGNSFAMGMGESLDEMFLTQLERHLRWRDQSIEVVKAGVGGYGTRHELTYYREFGERFAADMVLVLFFTGTDFRNNLTETRATVRSGLLVPTYKHSKIDGILERHCRLFSYVCREVRHTWLGKRVLAPLGFVKLAYPRHVAMLKKDYGEVECHAVRETKVALNGFARLCRERQSRLVLCVVPDKLQVQDDYLTEYTKSLGEVTLYDPNRPSQILEDICRELSIDCIDLLPQSRWLYGRGEKLYLDGDIHWSDSGRRLLSLVLAEALIALDKTANRTRTAVNLEKNV